MNLAPKKLSLAERIALKKAAKVSTRNAQQEAEALILEKDGSFNAYNYCQWMASTAVSIEESEHWEYLASLIDSLPTVAPRTAVQSVDSYSDGNRGFVQHQEPASHKKPSIAEKLAALKRIQSSNTLEQSKTEKVSTEKPKRSLAEILAEKRAAASARAEASGLVQEPASALVPIKESSDPTLSIPTAHSLTASFAEAPLNEKQQLACDYALQGQNFCLIGPAGSGKTFTQRKVAHTLHTSGKLQTSEFKIQGSGSRVRAPSIAFVAFTRRAAANLQRAIHGDSEMKEAFAFNIMTIHALLEFQPVFYFDDALQKETMRFVPQRTSGNPLDITHLVIEESSMVDLTLWDYLADALPEGVQIILIGDINQLPPVFGPSILNYGLVQLPVVELSKVYRQAGDSRILANAHHMLRGETTLEEGEDFVIMRGKNPTSVGQQKQMRALAMAFETLYEQGEYDPEQDIILSPYNTQDLGTDNVNKYIAQFLGLRRGAVVHEVLAGFNKHYLAVGDKIMVEKRDAVITRITLNGEYMGKMPLPASASLNRFGTYIVGMDTSKEVDEAAKALLEDDDGHFGLTGYENFSLESLEDQAAERKQQASHIVYYMFLDDIANVGEAQAPEREAKTAGDFNTGFGLAYALTVHKAQGCEWRHVYFILHKEHTQGKYRELCYTAVTRARKKFIWIAKDVDIEKAIKAPRIKGNSIAAKIEYFNAKLDMDREVNLNP